MYRVKKQATHSMPGSNEFITPNFCLGFLLAKAK